MNNIAFFSSSIKGLVDQTPETILGHLAKQNPFALDALQRNAWLVQISILQRELASLNSGWLAFEFAIPRMGKRAEQFDNAARDQVVDYALDLKNFHSGSHDRRIVPIVVATGAPYGGYSLVWDDDHVAKPILNNGVGLGALIKSIASQTKVDVGIDVNAWISSGYKPTPTIIEAAQALYQGHKVADITRSDAGAINLSQTAECIAQIIEDAKSKRRKAICFVTGVPGAGKTLAGLNLVTQRTKVHKDEHAVFLSGNGPLVDVLREALARDEHEQSKLTGSTIRKVDASRKVKSFIQNIMHFRNDNLTTSQAPIERVAVFDEAQRAWDRDHLANFMSRNRGATDFDMSEPAFLINVMNRHNDWCVVVCLVGGGQEIHAGGTDRMVRGSANKVLGLESVHVSTANPS
jgi:hypothetical protein